ncbi:MAG: KamA family radical SAM protein [Polyangiaceae bacterium]
MDSRRDAFRRRFFPETTDANWEDWRWQLRHRYRNERDLRVVLRLSEDESLALGGGAGALPLAITPYYASLLDPDNPEQPLRRTVIPTCQESRHGFGEQADPLHEESHTVRPGLVHRYPDRVLFLVTDHCSVFCRYCTRSRLVGKDSDVSPSRRTWQAALDYIAEHHEVRDVLLSGGDPLTLPDQELEWLLSRLRGIEHVELLRIGTKVPMVLPQRVTPQLVAMLAKYHPLWISIHATHPDELTEESTEALTRLANAGIPLGSQTVLLRGINDDPDTLRRLLHGLVRRRVKPYYLYQCDPILGSAHFRTPVKRGLQLIGSLRGHTTGYAVPTYVIDAPGGGGKVPIQPETIVSRDAEGLTLRGYQGLLFRYPDPEEELEAVESHSSTIHLPIAE